MLDPRSGPIVLDQGRMSKQEKNSFAHIIEGGRIYGIEVMRKFVSDREHLLHRRDQPIFETALRIGVVLMESVDRISTQKPVCEEHLVRTLLDLSCNHATNSKQTTNN
ncbi:hypothetical protein GCM10017774_37920 [Lentzea cavernae]|uniref:Uncharacterized protein n=1 Tax=Lentzea cavernae TaxID=2020703 RepID=A0ABQ3MEF9_9PSEU|nr:hypothetical protein GCM10017774_37920 [Lentzea cavernae]